MRDRGVFGVRVADGSMVVALALVACAPVTESASGQGGALAASSGGTSKGGGATATTTGGASVMLRGGAPGMGGSTATATGGASVVVTGGATASSNGGTTTTVAGGATVVPTGGATALGDGGTTATATGGASVVLTGGATIAGNAGTTATTGGSFVGATGGSIVASGGNHATGGAGNTGGSTAQAPTLDYSCQTDSDCCVALYGCMAQAWLVTKAQKATLESYLSTLPHDVCVSCIPPVVQVACVAGKCTGYKLSFTQETMSYTGAHCGRLPISSAGAAGSAATIKAYSMAVETGGAGGSAGAGATATGGAVTTRWSCGG